MEIVTNTNKFYENVFEGVIYKYSDNAETWW